MSLHHRLAHRQRGQSMVEFCIVVPLFLFLLLLILQMVLIYRAKSTLDYATFQAARTGATIRESSSTHPVAGSSSASRKRAQSNRSPQKKYNGR